MGVGENWAEEARTIEYRNNVTHSLRQEPGILYPLIGSTASYSDITGIIEDRFGSLRLQRKTTRNGDTNNTDPSMERRAIKKPGSSNVAPLLDRDDGKATKVDLQSPVVRETALATKQYHDDQVLKGWWGSAWGGERGDIAIPFPAANKVAANHGTNGGANTGLTLEKLIELKRRLSKANVNFRAEKPIILLDADAEADLFGIDKYVNFDYAGSKPLIDGELKPWMGFRFLQANLGDAEAYPEGAAFFQVGGVNRLPVIVPSGLHRGVWTEFWGKITERDDKQFSTQIYAEAESAVVRTDEKKAWFIETKPIA